MENQMDKIHQRVKGGSNLLKKYPELKDKKSKVHILFLNCLLNSSGMYRVVLPYVALNNSESHKAIIGSIHKWDFNKSFEDYDNAINRELIEWADYVVLPAMTSRFEPVYKTLKGVNPKIKIILDFDRLTFVAPTVKSGINLKQKLANQIGFANLRFADMVSCSTAALADYYEKIAKVLHPEKKLEFAIVPDLISQDAFIKLPHRELQQGKKMRIGIVGTPTMAKDFEAMSAEITSFFKEHSEGAELILMGWNGKLKGIDLFKGVAIEHHKAVQFQKYYSKVHSLNLDAVLLPHSVAKRYSFGKSAIKMIELSALGIAVITDGKSNVGRLLSDGETGFLVNEKNDWKAALEEVLNNRSKVTDVGHYAQKFIWKNFSWNSFKAKLLANTYI